MASQGNLSYTAIPGADDIMPVSLLDATDRTQQPRRASYDRTDPG